MSKIDELLKDEKVEWKKLGEVSEVGTGKSNTNEQVEDGEYPFYVRSKNIKRSNKYEFYETAIVIPGEGGIGEVFHYVEGRYALHQRAYRIHIIDDRLITKFVYHYMLNNFKKYIMKNAVYATVSSIRKPMIENFEIPIPSIETQEKIVKTLDKITNYVTELQAELQSRTKQYEYYRNMVLSEEYLNKISKKTDGLESKGYKVKFVKLGEIVDIVVGGDVPKDNFSIIPTDKYKIPIFSNGIEENSLYGFTNIAKVDKKSVTISARGTIGYVSYREEPYFPIVRLLCLIPRGDIVVKYLYYLLQNSKINHKETGIPSLTTDMIKNIKITLPPIEIQNIVVEILDKFQSLLADTKGLLPQEIEQRQKQYEYYREKLLTFDENSAKRERERAYLSNSYLNSLKEAGKIVGVSVFGVELKKLEDFAEIYDGTHQTPKYVNTGVPFVSVQDIKNIYGTDKYITIEEYSKFKIKPRKNDVFMTRIGDIGTCAIVENDDDLAYYVTLTLIRPSNDIVLSKFLKYLIESSQGKKELSKRILHNATPIKINLGEIGKLQFLIPSIQVQEHIVSILDKFDSIVNDISKGLPKEIELRQKQYEYYREKLLSFDR